MNLFGDVPLVLSTDYSVNSGLSRTSDDQVYLQIIEDLRESIDLLSEQFLDGALLQYIDVPERLRPTKWAARALLSRVYLYTGDFVNAEIESSLIIDQSSLFALTSLNEVFLRNSSEAIWQMQPVNDGHNTEEAWIFILPSTGPDDNNFDGHPVSISRALQNAFEPGDQRKIEWIDSIIVGSDSFYFPHKYKSATFGDPVNEYFMIFRLAEQYLIRAEARVQLGNIQTALDDLNIIRSRAGLHDSNGNSIPGLLASIQHERRVELFTEWGHRWFDLKRSGEIDAVMTVASISKGGSWQTTDQLYPIPFYEIQHSPHISQNSGY